MAIGDVAGDGSTLRFVRDLLPVPAELSPILQAQRLLRVRAGATPDEPLFTRDGAAASPGYIGMLARVALGISSRSTVWRRIVAAQERDERWLAERGVFVHRLRNQRRRTSDRLRSDAQRIEVMRVLQGGGRGGVADNCSCPGGHGAPRPVVPPARQLAPRPQAANHPWRRPWASTVARSRQASTRGGV